MICDIKDLNTVMEHRKTDPKTDCSLSKHLALCLLMTAATVLTGVWMVRENTMSLAILLVTLTDAGLLLGGMLEGTYSLVLNLALVLYWYIADGLKMQEPMKALGLFFLIELCLAANYCILVMLLRRNRREMEKELELVAALSEANERLRVTAGTDNLTGLKNRHSLREEFNGFIGRDVAVLYLDIDNFKAFNDNFGHETGDEALKIFSDALRQIFGGDACYRYGGDEFLVITDADRVPENAEEKLNILLKKLTPQHFMQVPTGTCGEVCGNCSSAAELRGMIREADHCLYTNKERKHAQSMAV